MEEIYNEGKDPLYQWKRLGDAITNQANSPATTSAPFPAMPIKQRGKTSKTFKAEVKTAVASIPASVMAKLQQAGAQVVAGRRLINIDRSLKGVQPRGWPPGMTWDNADGFARGFDAVVAEEYRDMVTGKYLKSRRVSGVVRHELGHVYDKALGNMSGSDPGFIAAYQTDLPAVLARPDAWKFSYYTQGGQAGQEEAFAELFAELLGGGTGLGSLSAAFPATAAVMKQVL